MGRIEMNRYQVLAAAEAAVKHRDDDYGSPQKNFERIAALWNVILAEKLGHDYDYEISAADVAMMMVAVKLSRLIETPDHDDSAVDLAGYAALLQEIA
jgi:hypothetical protein